MREIDVLAVVDSSLRCVRSAIVLRPHEERAVYRALRQLGELNLPEAIRNQALSVLRASAERENLEIDPADCQALLEVESASSDEPVLLEVNAENYALLYKVMDLMEERFVSDLQEVAAYAWALRDAEDEDAKEAGTEALGESENAREETGKAEADVLDGCVAELRERLEGFQEQVLDKIKVLEAEVQALRLQLPGEASERDLALKQLAAAVGELTGSSEADLVAQLGALSDDVLKALAQTLSSREDDGIEALVEQWVKAAKAKGAGLGTDRAGAAQEKEGFEAPSISSVSLDDLKVDDPRLPNPVEVSGPARHSSVEEEAERLSNQITEEEDDTFYAIWRIKR